MIKIEINNQDVVLEALNRVANGFANRTSLMATLAGTMQYAVDQNFESGGRPAWLGLKYREGQPLIDSGALRNSIQAVSDNEQAVVGTNLAYAPIHQFGGRTSPHTIRPRYKKALAFGGGVFGAVNHPGSVIPARPFLALTPQDEGDLIADVQDYFRNMIS